MALIDKLTAIADAIRTKTGGTDPLTLVGMAEAIAGISSGGGSGLDYDMGEFVLENDNNATTAININHNLGDSPEFILVWTDDYVGVTNPDTQYATCLGFVWMKNIMGLDNWLTTSVKGEGTTVNFLQAKGATDMTVIKPNSASYIMCADYVTDEYFRLVKQGSSALWRAGITYKYFVSKAWWNVGGIQNA